jgi:hypothetical protein
MLEIFAAAPVPEKPWPQDLEPARDHSTSNSQCH